MTTNHSHPSDREESAGSHTMMDRLTNTRRHKKTLYHAENYPQCRAASLDPQESHQNPTQTKYLASNGSEFGCLLLVFLTPLRRAALCCVQKKSPVKPSGTRSAPRAAGLSAVFTENSFQSCRNRPGGGRLKPTMRTRLAQMLF